MLSNPPTSSNIHSRQRLHRRQNSTPTAFEAVKIAPLSNFRQPQQQQQQQHQRQRSSVSHRRGMSLDTRRLHLQLQQQPAQSTTQSPTRQDFSSVSKTTNNRPGLSTTPQHILQETQQQRRARPGLSQLNNNYNNTPRHCRNESASSISSVSSIHTRGHSRNTSINHFAIDENSFLLSPHGTPQSQRFMDPMSSHGQIDDMGIPFNPYMSSSFDNINTAEFDLYAPNSALSTPTFMTFAGASPIEQQGWISEGETTNSRRTSRRISNGIQDRVSKFENIAQSNMDAERPSTSSDQHGNRCFPPTQTESSYDRTMQHTQRLSRPNRFAEDYDESMEETLKPVRDHRSNNDRNTSVFAELRQQAEAMAQSQAQNQTAMPVSYTNTNLSPPDYLNLTNMENTAFIKMEDEFVTLNNLPSGNVSQGTSPMPMHPNLANFNMTNAFDAKSAHHNGYASQETMHGDHGDSSAHSSRYNSPQYQHRRTESLASVVSAVSISEINIEETKTDTGVTFEEIAMYIDGPDSFNKYMCTFDHCGKKFGRKENIKSHVQTHLNDRQYQCPTCQKCFVRQHDLKRHAKIHTGIKPYPCDCGNSFARHDALTRHRQRGMCIGAFDGIVRKVVKRGRPKKMRPEMDERLEKSERTRRKNKAETSTPSESSQSGYSDSSAGNSPNMDFDGLPILDDAPFHNMNMMDAVSLSTPAGQMDLPDPHETKIHISPGGISTAEMPPSSPYEAEEPVTSVSPEQITSAVSPPIMSTYLFQELPTLPTYAPRPANKPNSPAKSRNYSHQPDTPPELSASSSPPHGDNNEEPQYIDEFDPNVSGLSDHSIGLGTTAAAHAACGGSELTDIDDDGAWGINEDGLMQLHEEMMAGSGSGNAKYFDDAEDAIALFTNGDDVFFGSS